MEIMTVRLYSRIKAEDGMHQIYLSCFRFTYTIVRVTVTEMLGISSRVDDSDKCQPARSCLDGNTAPVATRRDRAHADTQRQI